MKSATHTTAFHHTGCAEQVNPETQCRLEVVKGQGRGGGGVETGSNWLMGTILWNDSTVLEVDSGGGCITLTAQ